MFFHFLIFSFCISSKYIFFDILINFCFSVFLSSSVFIFSLTLLPFFVPSLSQSVGISFCDSSSFSFTLFHSRSLYDITWCNSIFLFLSIISFLISLWIAFFLYYLNCIILLLIIASCVLVYVTTPVHYILFPYISFSIRAIKTAIHNFHDFSVYYH